MSFSEIAISVRDLSKRYAMFRRPEDRLKQMVMPRLQSASGMGVKRYFDDFAALQHISFDVPRGQTVGIIGRNGSGKSTLLQIICGTLRPTSGKVEVNGRIAALLELGAGFNPEFTGRENVYLNAAILGLKRPEIDKRFDSIASFADIGQFLDQPVKTYSSGMYVRLAFATAINIDPDILVVDEALAVGDEAFRRKCYARIEEIQEKGGTILFVSHGPQAIVQLCSHAIMLDAGELILQGDPKLVTAQYQRLVNLTGDEAAKVREQIRSLGADALIADAAKPVSEGGLSAQAKPDAQQISLDWFDASLKPETTVGYEPAGGYISNVRIASLDGREVNVLQANRVYRFLYTFTAHTKAQDVSFGMHFKTTQGLELCGANTDRDKSHRLSSVEEGEALEVEFQFTCLLRPGTYFANAGAMGTIGEHRKFLHRLLDVTVFRVVSETDDLDFGFFKLGVAATTRKLRTNYIEG